jgi:carbon-monoxide dehydrogenase medium subunit
MKLPAFDYAAPTTLAEAIALLAAGGGAAKALAGGQSLLPVLAFRLASPSLLVDLRRLPGLDHIAIDAHGARLGACVRWRDILNSDAVRAAHPLLCAAIGHVAHYQVRNRGTVGGSLAHADPAAELPGIAVACDAEIAIEGAAGPRCVRAADFFRGALATALKDDELIVELRFPPWRAGRPWGFQEFARRRGDFALAGVAAWYDLDGEGRASNVHVGVIGAGDRPHRLPRTEASMHGVALTDAAIAAAARIAHDEVEPPSDLHAGAAYRRSLVATLLERALVQARDAAR